MSHRAEQIVAAVADAIRTIAESHVEIFEHSRSTVYVQGNAEQRISVDYGEDTPLDDGSSFLDGTIESLLTINATSVVLASNENDVRRTLLELRSLIHRAIGPGKDRLGLEFALDVHYAGAQPPEVDVGDSLPIVGELVSQWGVRYRMSRNNPEF